MATKTRYKSVSPIATPASIASTLSQRDMFSSVLPPPPPVPLQRRSEVAILNYHNARPTGESKISLPPASSILPPPPTSFEGGGALPFGWEQQRKTTRHSKGLSIQSLISSPAGMENGNGYEERGMKRKGSDITDRDDDRSSRGTSVVSTTGLSMEDPDVRDAVEALGGLKADFAHPLTAPNSPPNTTQQEPLLNLIQNSASSVHPLLSTALSISSSTYTASKNYIRPFRYVAESAESITAPVVRRTGLEGYIRRGLENKRRKAEKETPSSSPLPPPPPPPLEERKCEQGWQSRLYYSSTGLATALSDESRRSLKYCLRILFSANANLVKVIETLSSVVDELDRYLQQKSDDSSSTSGIAGYLPESYEQRRQRLAETVDCLKDEALKTLKQVVDTISRYAGGALPEQARNIVKRQLLSFPLRWQASTSDVERGVVIPENGDDGGRKTKGKAVRVLVMAREGLDMMRSVAEVVEGTLVSADEWCERFGKGKDDEEKAGEKKIDDEKAGCVENNNVPAAAKDPEKMDVEETTNTDGMAKAG
ncbi:Opi1-domain-containing protein [Wilcoxina mikolae CBS 423.85]|nr:Opi1-domain-containing protein [Wilcoxina mikolae CBS 423.85]